MLKTEKSLFTTRVAYKFFIVCFFVFVLLFALSLKTIRTVVARDLPLLIGKSTKEVYNLFGAPHATSKDSCSFGQYDPWDHDYDPLSRKGKAQYRVKWQYGENLVEKYIGQQHVENSSSLTVIFSDVSKRCIEAQWFSHIIGSPRIGSFSPGSLSNVPPIYDFHYKQLIFLYRTEEGLCMASMSVYPQVNTKKMFNMESGLHEVSASINLSDWRNLSVGNSYLLKESYYAFHAAGGYNHTEKQIVAFSNNRSASIGKGQDGILLKLRNSKERGKLRELQLKSSEYKKIIVYY